MNLLDYQREMNRTAGGFEHKLDALMMGVLGLTGEASELLTEARTLSGCLVHGDRSHLLKEVGDVLWYATHLCHQLGQTLGFAVEVALEHEGPPTTFDDLQAMAMGPGPSPGGADWGDHLLFAALDVSIQAGRMAELFKKEIFHRHTPDLTAKLRCLGHLLLDLSRVCHYASPWPESLTRAAEMNVAKLRARYPDKFSVEKAQARADEGGGA